MKASSTTLITPRLQVLSEDQKETLFLSALEVLECTGVRVDNDEGLELLSSAGARVGPQRRVHIPSFLVEDALASAPRRIAVYRRDGKRAVSLEDRCVYFASQVDSTYLFDPFDRSRRLCVRKDASLGAVLCDALPHIDLVSFSSLYSDIPGKIAIRVGHKDTVMNCTKPLMHGTGDFTSLKAIAEMAAVVVGGWDELARRPYYVHYAEPFSPLIHTDEGVAKLLFCVEHGIPVIYTPMTLAGSSAPVTAAGNLVACMAESLSGLVMAQLKRRGAPVIFGGVPTIIDMSTTLVSYGAPEMSLWSAALTEMAHYLHLPVFSTAGCTDAVAFDQQAAAESAISCLMAALSGANLVHDVGFTEAANSASLELIAATDEFISMIHTIMDGIKVTPETLALEVMEQVGPGGSYFGEKHTVRHFRQNWFPKLMNRGNYDQWTAAGSLSLGDKTNQRVRHILRQHQPEPLSPEIVAELDKMEKHWWKEVP
ncbi:MAG: trimethylamine methyltransferase family protein [Anaerolineae bacterium]|nr:trimethylamine methyltransferase family protein [Anaerolineae bacterium]